MMDDRINHFPHLLACACMLLASLSYSTFALADDSEPAESKPALSKIQDLKSRASELAMRAVAMLGIRYRYGGNTPENGLDCSGLVRHVFKESWGANLPRTSEEISRMGQNVGTHELQPGDLVFYNTLRRGFSHVGIYLGDNKFIHSPSAGGQVRIESMDIAYWKKRFNGARRLSDPQQSQNSLQTQLQPQ